MRTREKPVSTWRGLDKSVWAQPLMGRDGEVGGTWYTNRSRGPGPGTEQSTVGVWPQGLSRGGRLGSDCAVVRVGFWWALVALGRTEGTQSATPGGRTQALKPFTAKAAVEEPAPPPARGPASAHALSGCPAPARGPASVHALFRGHAHSPPRPCTPPPQSGPAPGPLLRRVRAVSAELPALRAAAVRSND